jgi:hypothetical protein
MGKFILKCLVFSLIFGFNWGFSQNYIPNPDFILSYDLAKYQVVYQKLKLPTNIFLASAEDLLGLKSKIAQLSNQNYFMMSDWEALGNASFSYFSREFGKGNQACWHLQAQTNEVVGLGTSLNLPLRAGQTYCLKIKYKLLNDLPNKDKAQANLPIGILITNRQPADYQRLKAQFWLKMPQQPQVSEARRSKILKEFKQNYGGNYGNNFALDESIPEWTEMVYYYTAQGGEDYLAIKYFANSNPNTLILAKIDLYLPKVEYAHPRESQAEGKD